MVKGTPWGEQGSFQPKKRPQDKKAFQHLLDEKLKHIF